MKCLRDPANELTAINFSPANNPVHDARGNMTTMPKPGDLTTNYTCTYDAWAGKRWKAGQSPTFHFSQPKKQRKGARK